MASGETKPYAYTCEYCDRQFCDKTGLSKHVKIHTSEKTFFCDECDSAFFEKRDLSRHKASHLNKKTPEFNIEWRYKSVQADSNDASSVEESQQEKEYLCNFCEKTFTQRSSCTRHMQSHKNEKPHTCNTCGKNFTRKGHLQRHELTHLGKKKL